MTPQEILSTYSLITEERKKEHGIYPGMVNDAWVATCEELLKGKDEEIERLKFDNKYLSDSLNDLLADNKPNP